MLATTSLRLEAFRRYMSGGIGMPRGMDMEQICKEENTAKIREYAPSAGSSDNCVIGMHAYSSKFVPTSSLYC